MKNIEEFPAAYPDQSDHSPPLQVVNSSSVLHPGIPPPDLPQETPSYRSLSFEDMEALTSIVPDTSEPHQTMIVANKMHSLPLHKAGLFEDANKISRNLTDPCLQTTHTFICEDTHTLSRADTWLPRDVSFEKIQTPSQAEATAIENLSRTSPRAVPSQHTKSARDSSPEATSWTTSESSFVSVPLQFSPPSAVGQTPAFPGYSATLPEQSEPST
ncbi:hypothetical protein MRX96_051683 [Rhipicephalus microplus]